MRKQQKKYPTVEANTTAAWQSHTSTFHAISSAETQVGFILIFLCLVPTRHSLKRRQLTRAIPSRPSLSC
jgi:hypothetical protein